MREKYRRSKETKDRGRGQGVEWGEKERWRKLVTEERTEQLKAGLRTCPRVRPIEMR